MRQDGRMVTDMLGLASAAVVAGCAFWVPVALAAVDAGPCDRGQAPLSPASGF